MFIVLGLGCLVWLSSGFPSHQTTAAGSQHRPPTPRGASSFREVLASPAMWGIMIGTFCYSYFYMFYMTWLPSYFVERRGLSFAR